MDNLVPIWKDTCSQDSLESYLAQMSAAKDFGICKSDTDRLLIYRSLQKSNLFDIFTSLSEVQKNDLDKYAAFIRHNFSESRDEQRARLSSLQQSESETASEFLRKCEKTYFRIRGIEVPQTLNEWQKADIKHHFIVGLRSVEVKTQLIIDSTPYEQLGTRARQIESLSQFSKNSNHVHAINDSPTTDYEFSYQNASSDSDEQSEYQTSYE